MSKEQNAGRDETSFADFLAPGVVAEDLPKLFPLLATHPVYFRWQIQRLSEDAAVESEYSAGLRLSSYDFQLNSPSIALSSRGEQIYHARAKLW